MQCIKQTMAKEKVGMDVNEEKKEGIKSYGLGIRHLQVACMMLNVVCLIIVRGNIGVAVLAMSDTKHQNSTVIEVYDWDKQTQSIILSSFFWGYVAMQIPAGILTRKFGGKPTIMFSLLANGLICLMVPTLAAWGGWILVCASRVTLGLTQAFLFPGTFTLLGQWLPAAERTSFTGVVFGGTKIGIILAMALSGVLANSALGWKSIFYTSGGIVLVNLIVWYFCGASYPREHRWISEEEKKYIEDDLNVSNAKRPPTPWKHILRSKAVWALVPPHCGFAICYGFFLGDLPTYLEKGLGISLKSSAFLSMLPYVGMWAGGTSSSFISEKLYNNGWLALTTCRKLFQTIALFGAAAGLVFLSFLGPENKTLAMVTLITSLTLSGASTAGFAVNQLDLSPNYAGILMSVLNGFATLGCAIIPILTSLILQNDPTNVVRWQIVFLLIAGICVSCAILYLIFATSERQPWDDFNYLEKKLADPAELTPVLSEKNTTQKVISENNGRKL